MPDQIPATPPSSAAPGSPYTTETPETSRPMRGRFLLATAVIVLLGALLVVDLRSGVVPDLGIDYSALKIVLGVMVSMTAIIAGALIAARWWIDRHPADLWIAMGLLILGVVVYGAAGLLPLLGTQPSTGSLLSWMKPIGVVAALFAFWRGLMVGSSRRVRAWNLAVVAAAFLILAVQALSPVTELVANPGEPISIQTLGWGTVLLILAALALAIGYGVKGLRVGWPLQTAVGLMLATIVLGQVIGAFGESAHLDGELILPLIGLLVVLLAVVNEVQTHWSRRERQLLESETMAHEAHEEVRRVQASMEDRAHDARSALTAIEGALALLERGADRLDDTAWNSLQAAAGSEIARLQRMIAPREEALQDEESFLVADVLRQSASVERLHGSKVTLNVSPDLTALGKPTALAEVMHNVLDNARRYAPGPVEISADREDDLVMIRVEDQGPGVPVQWWERIFQRGVRGPTS
ncbi:MAG TPA: MFS domain-containing histidine kinase, partial [Acidimicrobiia bacterium]|nr:MFS domain-containing histidine kinase [Acidimicrobiia bacterium]